MFDDLKNNNQATATPPETDKSAKTDDLAMSKQATEEPAKLATEDMFATTDPAAETHDTHISDRPSAIQSGKIKSVNPNQTQSVAPAPKDMADPSSLSGDIGGTKPARSGIAKKIGLVLFVVLIVAGLAWGGYIYWLSRANTPSNDSNNEQDIIIVIDEENQDEADQNNETTDVVPPEPIDPEDIDDDSDGISNVEEIRLGTNPFEADTDNDSLFDQDEIEIYGTNPTNSDSDEDGLLDYDEVMVWMTNPLETDTDGDGFSDGTEVDSGYNPLGEGTIDDWAPPLPLGDIN